MNLYDPDIEVIKRGKSNAAVEIKNRLWLGETKEGLIADYPLEKNQSNDAHQVTPAMERLVSTQWLLVKKG